MTTLEAQNKAIVRRFFEAFAANDLAALKAVLAPDLVAYSHGQPGAQNREAHLEGIRMWNAAFGDTQFDIEEQIAEGDKVASRVRMRSVHSRGAYLGLPPTGKQVVSSSVTIERIKDALIVERRVVADWSSMMQQLGLAAAPAQGGS